MVRRFALHKSVLNVLALACLESKDHKVQYNRVFRAFEKLAREKPEFFPGLYFYSAGGEPHSSALEKILSSLGTWHILSVGNPRYEWLTINRNAITVEGIKDNILKDHDHDETVLSEYQNLAQEFAAQVGGCNVPS